MFRLKRKKLIKIIDNYYDDLINYSKDDLPYKKIRKCLNNIEVCIRRHKYNNDYHFTSRGRRNFLKGEIVDYLKVGKYKEALMDFKEYIYDESYNYPSISDFDSLEEARDVQEYNQTYANKGIVCKEDRANILEIVHLFRYYLKIN